jgi:hypothetical protein
MTVIMQFSSDYKGLLLKTIWQLEIHYLLLSIQKVDSKLGEGTCSFASLQ